MTNALVWDTVPSAKYEPVNLIPPVLPELRKRSEVRVAADKDFDYVREEIERYKKAREEKTVSMNEAERLKEKKDTEARVEARKKELRARPLPTYTTYDLNLKNILQPGLPAPTPKTNTVAEAKEKATNTVAKAIKPPGNDAEEEVKDDSSVPAVDITMDEGRRILQDLVALSGRNNGMAGRP